MSNNKNMFLWWVSGSPPCWSVIIVLQEKGLWEGCPNKLCELSKKEHKGEDVLKLNPRGQMPTFRDGDVVINESSAICLYLEENYSNDSNCLLPKDLAKRAEVYQKMFEASNVRSNVMMNTVVYKMSNKKENWNMELLKENYAKANAELKLWDDYLKGRNYLAADTFTMADAFFYPFIGNIVRQGACLEKKYPALYKYYKTVEERPSVKSTQPPHWNDNPSPGLLSDLCD